MEQTILLIEDEADVRSLATFLLEKHGYKVAAFEYADDAMGWVDKNLETPPALVLSDFNYPDPEGGMRGGYFVSKHARAAYGDTVQIVLMSGNARMLNDEDKQYFDNKLCPIEKPFKNAVLIDTVNAHIMTSSPHSAEPARPSAPISRRLTEQHVKFPIAS